MYTFLMIRADALTCSFQDESLQGGLKRCKKRYDQQKKDAAEVHEIQPYVKAYCSLGSELIEIDLPTLH